MPPSFPPAPGWARPGFFGMAIATCPSRPKAGIPISLRARISIWSCWFICANVFGQVDFESVLSGPGQFHIYEFLRDTKRGTEPAWLAAEIRQRRNRPKSSLRSALENKSDLCVQALDMFVDYYGAEAANLALKVLATGGVYIGGGIAPKIISKLTDGKFMKAFVGVAE